MGDAPSTCREPLCVFAGARQRKVKSPAALLLARHCAAAAAAPRCHVSRSAVTASDGHQQPAALMDSVALQLSITDKIGSPGRRS